MRRIANIILIMLTVLVAGSCQRRPFAEHRSKVALNVNVNTNVVNHHEIAMPENMRVDLYDPLTGKLKYTDYVGPTGGYIHPAPGVYDMIVYSIGTESTIVHNEHHFDEIEAYTNEVSAFIKSQMAQFLAKRAQAAQERAAKKYAALMQSGGSEIKGPKPFEDELVVNQPDHIFIGWYHNLDIPVIYEDDGDIEIYVEVDAHTIVETWQVEVRNIEGAEWIGSTISLMSGQKGSVHMGPNVHSERVVSVYFDMKVQEREDGGGMCLKGKLNTFGIHPDNLAGATLDLNVRDKGGSDFVYHFEVTDQFQDNPDRYILIDEKIVVEEPKASGGGFQPVVDDWDKVHTDIIL